jgi:hypothetical protein
VIVTWAHHQLVGEAFHAERNQLETTPQRLGTLAVRVRDIEVAADRTVTAGCQQEYFIRRLRVPRDHLSLVELVHDEDRIGTGNMLLGYELRSMLAQIDSHFARDSEDNWVSTLSGHSMQTRGIDRDDRSVAERAAEQGCGHRAPHDIAAAYEKHRFHVACRFETARRAPQGAGHSPALKLHGGFVTDSAKQAGLVVHRRGDPPGKPFGSAPDRFAEN